MSDQKGFTGRTRRRTTRGTVVLADIAARLFITVGGIGTIVAVLLVCFFLAWVVWPLIVGGTDLDAPRQITTDTPDFAPLHLEEDEYRVLTWVMLPDGTLRLMRLDDGSILREEQLFGERQITSTSFLVNDPLMAVGFADGSIELLRITFDTSFIPDDSERLDGETRRLLETSPQGESVRLGEGIVQRTPKGDYRLQELAIERVQSIKVADGPVHLVDHVILNSGPLIAFVTGDAGDYQLSTISGREKSDFLTGQTVLQFGRPEPQPVEAMSDDVPAFLGISGPGSDLYVAWSSGEFFRTRRPQQAEAFVAEFGRMVAPGLGLTTMGFIVNDATLVWSDSSGHVFAGFPVRIVDLREQGLESAMLDVELTERAEFALARAKHLVTRKGPAMRSMAISARSRLVACGFEDGTISLFNVTNQNRLASRQLAEGQAVTALAIAPKEDGVVAAAAGQLFAMPMIARHHEVSFASLFLPVWYESYPGPTHTYQSSAGHSGSEPKYGMIPLIFGTIKATFYSMLIGAPLAILAAIYSSEFLHPRVKSAVKPTIELMASLPSVVLGFLAALVFAPFIDSIVPTTLATFLTVPFCFLLGAYLWQLLPNHLAIYLANMGLTVPIPRNTFDRAWNAVQKGIFLLGGVRLICIMLMLIAGVGMAFAIGPFIDQWLFAGDVKRWLNWTPDHPNAAQTRQYASVVGGWTFLLLPFTAIITALLMTWLISPVMRRIGNAMSRGKLAWLDLAKFLGGAAFALGLALGCGLVFNAIGLDPRSEFGIWGIDLSPVDTYVQRNSLIVGVVMGFAIIPIIYTICDDALSAVPEHLRSASLGAGATPWQTAVRIVIPTAMSGMFSAVMIGLGRAVGETMIVLMASGGTPIMDMNIFSGFRTLSQNIANELPEAPKDGTHYLTLFLAALVLFAMTFILNTIAETVRLRFRKRAYQL